MGSLPFLCRVCLCAFPFLSAASLFWRGVPVRCLLRQLTIRADLSVVRKTSPFRAGMDSADCVAVRF